MGDIVPNPVWAAIKGGLRSLAALRPEFAWMGQAWSEYDAYRTGERIQELFENLKSDIRRLSDRLNIHEDLISLNHDDFVSLIEVTVQKVRRESSQEKRRVYARAFANLALRDTERQYDDKLAILHDLDTLTTRDLQVLRLFQSKTEATAEQLDWLSLGLSGDQNGQLEQLASHLGKLESRGLILTVFTHTGVVYTPSGMKDWAARWQETRYRLLPSGKAIIEAITE
jgi:hypothetical protein